MNRELARDVYKSLRGMSKLLRYNYDTYKRLRYKAIDSFSIMDVYAESMYITINSGDYRIVVDVDCTITVYKYEKYCGLTIYDHRPTVNNLRMILNDEYLTYCILRIYNYLAYEAQNKQEASKV